MNDPTRRNILKGGAAAAAMAAMPRVFAQQAGKGGTGEFYEKGPVRIRYEEAGSGFPLMLFPGGGLNATPVPERLGESVVGRLAVTASIAWRPSADANGATWSA